MLVVEVGEPVSEKKEVEVIVLCKTFRYPDTTILDLSKHQEMTSVSSRYTLYIITSNGFCNTSKHTPLLLFIVLLISKTLKHIMLP